MRRFLVGNVGFDMNKEEYINVPESDLENGAYKLDGDYIEVGEIVKVNEYEEGLTVLELDTGIKVVEIKVRLEVENYRIRYISMGKVGEQIDN